MSLRKTIAVSVACLAVFAVAAVFLVFVGAPAKPDQVALAKAAAWQSRMVCSAANQYFAEHAVARCPLADLRVYLDYKSPKFPAAYAWLNRHAWMPAWLPWPTEPSAAGTILVAECRDGVISGAFVSSASPGAKSVSLATGGCFAVRVPGVDRRDAAAPKEMSAQRQLEADVVVFEVDTGLIAKPVPAVPVAPAATPVAAAS